MTCLGGDDVGTHVGDMIGEVAHGSYTDLSPARKMACQYLRIGCPQAGVYAWRPAAQEGHISGFLKGLNHV